MGAEGAGSVEPLQRNTRRVRLSGRSLSSKPLESSQIIAGEVLNAPSDGAFSVLVRHSLCANDGTNAAPFQSCWALLANAASLLRPHPLQADANWLG